MSSVQVRLDIMTDFRTTESMGVEGKKCSCESKTLSPIEAREAQIIEDSCEKIGNQWLIPYPWVNDAAELPDNRRQAKMEEMSEMNFSHKLSNEELKSYKGPIHYISHHKVVRPEKKSTPII